MKKKKANLKSLTASERAKLRWRGVSKNDRSAMARGDGVANLAGPHSVPRVKRPRASIGHAAQIDASQLARHRELRCGATVGVERIAHRKRSRTEAWFVFTEEQIGILRLRIDDGSLR